MRYKYSLTGLIQNVMGFVFSLAILGLILRFFLRLFGADPDAGFVEFIYDSTAPLIEPFDELFTPTVVEQNMIIEYTTLFSILLYLVVLFLILEVIAYIGYQSANYREVEVE